MNKIQFFFLLSVAMYPVYAMEKPNLAKVALEEYLTNELKDANTGQELATIFINDILTQKAPTIPIAQINSIVAYAFGNRILPNGNRKPGPVNVDLADLVVKLYKRTKAPVYAQWEIAEAIEEEIPTDHITVINPTLDAAANVVYLSTAGVGSAIVKQAGCAQKLGKVAVIGFKDHLH